MCCQSIDLLFLEWICGKMHPFLVSRRYSKGSEFGDPDLGFRVQGFRLGARSTRAVRVQARKSEIATRLASRLGRYGPGLG